MLSRLALFLLFLCPALLTGSLPGSASSNMSTTSKSSSNMSKLVETSSKLLEETSYNKNTSLEASSNMNTSVSTSSNSSEECGLFLAPSRIRGAGMGIFAGKSYQPRDLIETSLALIVESVLIQSLSPINYVYNSLNPSYAAYLIGTAAMMNHLQVPNAHRNMIINRNIKMDIQSVSLRPYGTYHKYAYTAEERIVAGHEIFTNYGDISWFEERGIAYNATESNTASSVPGYDMKELKQIGHCLSDVVIKDSTLPMAGKGLFVTKSVSQGEVVAISPGLLVPHHRIKIEGASSVLLNYLFVSPGADVAVLPIGHGAMVNHGGELAANVEWVWYNEVFVREGDVPQDQRLYNADPEDLVDRESGAVYFALKALRSLDYDEEILLNYGPDWESKWQKYLESLKVWIELHGSEDVSFAPQFRHPIHISPDVFPPTFYQHCVGLDCDKVSMKSHSREYHQAVLNAQESSRMTLEVVLKAQEGSVNRSEYLAECLLSDASSGFSIRHSDFIIYVIFGLLYVSFIIF